MLVELDIVVIHEDVRAPHLIEETEPGQVPRLQDYQCASSDRIDGSPRASHARGDASRGWSRSQTT